MMLVYIAGPYSAPTYIGREYNILAARDVAVQLAAAGYGYYCPHLNSAHFDSILPNIPIAFWYDMDLRVLSHCDALVLLPGWERSIGTRRERDYALDCQIPVYETLMDLFTAHPTPQLEP